ncbi:MAG TPA: hypothetical protein EYG03_27480 [Planctomycetes bacterium]|nr:hypothetical protein [Fuerstiella sp.]HIK95706.1 hypothetical protein [Planctomycetota bacterium]
MDLTYRFDPYAPIPMRDVPDSDAAIKVLSEGNLQFAEIVRRIQDTMQGKKAESTVIPEHPITLGLPVLPGVVLTQSPFAVVLSCADARVNVERLFGQSFNSMFIVRIAGNVLGTDCLGSVDYALKHLADSLKLVVVLGHSQCGAVTAAVDSYLTPQDFGEIAFTHPLRSLLDRMQIAVRIAATTLQSQFGTDVSQHPNYRDAVVEASVFVNAAVTSFDLAREVENLHVGGMKIVFGVYDFESLLVQAMPSVVPISAEAAACFHDAPRSQDEFRQLAIEIVQVAAARQGIRL